MFAMQPVASYLSFSEPVVHIGLGAAEVEAIQVTWPDGSTSSVQRPEIDTRITVRYEAGTAR